MRILVADYSGHPFQVQLSRELARRGHHVRHVHFAGFQTPKGNLVRTAADPAGFEVAAVNTGQPFAKASFVRRRRQEIEVGHALAGQVRDFRPDAVLASNNPLDSQAIFQRAARRAGAHFTFWLQDIYSAAISRVVPRKFPGIGHLVAAFYRRLEFRMLRSSDAVVAITADFLPILHRRGVHPGRVAVIENWAPLDELPAHPRGNAWAEAHMPGAAPRFVYSGTLGYKHDPGILLALAAHLPECRVHVFSEGAAATALARDAAAGGLANLTVHRWVPFADLPEMLGGADVFVATIEAEAGVYSVPSKILTYLAIGRPILAQMPPGNLAAKLIAGNDAGYVFAPDNRAGFLETAARLARDPEIRLRLGGNGRAYAQANFAIGAIADRFEQILPKLAPASQAATGVPA